MSGNIDCESEAISNLQSENGKPIERKNVEKELFRYASEAWFLSGSDVRWNDPESGKPKDLQREIVLGGRKAYSTGKRKYTRLSPYMSDYEEFVEKILPVWKKLCIEKKGAGAYVVDNIGGT